MSSKYTFLLLFAIVLSIPATQAQTKIITTFAGNGTGASTGTGGYSGDGGFATNAELNSCTAVTFDGAGNVYIADRENNVVRKVSYLGYISTFAGTGAAGYTGDTSAATAARLSKPYGVAVDVPGNVYIADYGNNVIRKISTNGKIYTYAGTGVAGYSGNGGAATAARLNGPQGIAVDQYGNVFVAEAGNHVIREITTSGTIRTVAGNGTLGYSGNGGDATIAQLYAPAGVTVDVYGNIYIADYYNNVVRKVDTNGIISNFAGNHTLGHSGDGGQATDAELHFPSGVSIYGHGSLYISDQGSNAVRKVDDSGIITNVAGTPVTNGYNGDHGPATAAQLGSPKGLAVDGLDRVYIADYDNNVIRLVAYPTSAVASLPTAASVLNVRPNPSTGSFTVTLPQTSGSTTVTVTDVTGKVVATQKADAKTQTISFNLTNMPSGNYFVKADAGNKTYRQQIVLQ